MKYKLVTPTFKRDHYQSTTNIKKRNSNKLHIHINTTQKHIVIQFVVSPIKEEKISNYNTILATHETSNTHYDKESRIMNKSKIQN